VIDERTRFSDEKYINVQTPMWFADETGTMYARTFEKTGKVKRLRREPRVRVAARRSRYGLRAISHQLLVSSRKLIALSLFTNCSKDPA
jgi:general stress protein 26